MIHHILNHLSPTLQHSRKVQMLVNGHEVLAQALDVAHFWLAEYISQNRQLETNHLHLYADSDLSAILSIRISAFTNKDTSKGNNILVYRAVFKYWLCCVQQLCSIGYVVCSNSHELLQRTDPLQSKMITKCYWSSVLLSVCAIIPSTADALVVALLCHCCYDLLSCHDNRQTSWCSIMPMKHYICSRCH